MPLYIDTENPHGVTLCQLGLWHNKQAQAFMTKCLPFPRSIWEVVIKPSMHLAETLAAQLLERSP